MRLIANIGTVLALVLCGFYSWAQDAHGSQTCSADVREALHTALQYSIADIPVDYTTTTLDRKSPAIPDYNVLPHDGPILFRTYLDDPKCIIDSSVLPKSAKRAFVLVDDEHLLRRARRSANGVTYVRAMRVRFSDDELNVYLGTALRLPPGDKRSLLCCCAGDMVLRRVDGTWHFVEWRNVECA
jgi:hypothetical protein